MENYVVEFDEILGDLRIVGILTHLGHRCGAGIERHRQRLQLERAARLSAEKGGGSRGPMQKYPAVCAQCGKETEVPFEPRSGRPVYCSDCYRKVKR